MSVESSRAKVLVCAPISEPSIALLHQHAEVDVRTDLSARELLDVIGGYEALVVSSKIGITEQIIERAERLRIIGGTDAMPDLDLLAAKKRGISVISTNGVWGSAGESARADATADMALAQQISELINEIDNLMSLRVVDTATVFAHEKVEPRRVGQLADWLSAEGRLLHPPLVMPAKNGYVILDGATRIAALRALGYPHVIVQVVRDRSRLSLYGWSHALRHADAEGLVSRLRALPAVAVAARPNGSERHEPERFVCSLQTRDGNMFDVVAAAHVDPLAAANEFSDTYAELCHVSRTTNSDVSMLRFEYPDLAALVTYPQKSISEVLEIAESGHVLPAGITRFVIPGRVLRLNVDLTRLGDEETLEDKNQWLIQMLLDKKAKNRVRYYREPVYLLDD